MAGTTFSSDSEATAGQTSGELPDSGQAAVPVHQPDFRAPRNRHGEADTSLPHGDGTGDEPLDRGVWMPAVRFFGNFVSGLSINGGLSPELKEQYNQMGITCLMMMAILAAGAFYGVINGYVAVAGMIVLGALAAYCFQQANDPPQLDYARVVDFGVPVDDWTGIQMPHPWSEVLLRASQMLALVRANLHAKERAQGAKLAGDLPWELTHRMVAENTDLSVRRFAGHLASSLEDAAEHLRLRSDYDLTATEVPAWLVEFEERCSPVLRWVDAESIRRIALEGGVASIRIRQAARVFCEFSRGRQ